MIRFAIAAFSYFAAASVAAAGDNQVKETVRLGIYAGLTDSYPESQGVMWSDRVVATVFLEAGLSYRSLEHPARRLALTLESGDIDCYLSTPQTMQLSAHKDKFIHSKLPVSVITWFIYFDHRKKWQPVWPPDDIMLKKIGKSKQSSESLRNGWRLNITQSATSDAIAIMVHSGRVDYWIDNSTGLRTLSKNLFKSKEEGFSYDPLFRRPLLVYFQKSTRGRMLLDIFNQGFMTLLSQGRYRDTYHLDDRNPARSRAVDQTLLYFLENHKQVPIQDGSGG